MSKAKKKLCIGIDLMGHDNAPETLLEKIREIDLPPHVHLMAIGLPEYRPFARSIAYQSASEVIEMGDSPLGAIRKKKDSSLCVGLRCLKEQKIDVFISAGNTGALVSAAKTILGMQPQVSRPALLALLPTEKKRLAVLDVGAGIEASASQLVQFAFMGSAYQKSRGIEKPVVGLLNMGSEPTKGSEALKTAYKELKNLKSAPFQFYGNVEGSHAFQGNIDVLVTSGFTGNVFLKTSEGIANFLSKQLYVHIPKSTLEPHLAELKKKIHYTEYPGAILVGVKGHVIKCHGYSPPESFVSAIQSAILELISV